MSTIEKGRRAPATTDPVREFYTRHPYPPPVDNLDRARGEWGGEARLRAEHHLLWPDRPYRPDLDILVAGCGTWQAAKYAVCRPDARIVGIDVSPTSIECTAALKRKYGLANLELREAPLECAGELGQRFDLIVCTGVLHHLVDPDAGLRALGSVLKPEGVISLMVYAPYGRSGVYLLQEYCRRLGIRASGREIRELAATLAALPRNHPSSALLGGSRDARSADALADALLNPRDQAYSVPALLDLIERNGLTLGRWYWQAPYLPQCGAISATPHASRLMALPIEAQYAALELWRGTMACHCAVVRRSAGGIEGKVSFDDERWRRYVPLRLPWTELIQERLPAGAAGVLLNRSHAHPDLILVIDATELTLFGGIDGRRSLAEIADRAGVADAGRVRRFFETLWRYDQVSFDASRAR